MSRDEEIHQLMYGIAGNEISLLRALQEKDWDYVKTLKILKNAYYERLRKVSHGLPTENWTQAKS